MARWLASSLACLVPWEVSAGSAGMPVGEGIEAEYAPVVGSTDQLDRN